MNAKNRIKIVKRGERERITARPVDRAESKVAERAPQATRKVAQQVGAWVKEFRERQLRESGRSFARIFQRA